MKKTFLSVLALLLLLASLLPLAACGEQASADQLWANARYSENTTVGEGAITVQIEVKAGERAVTITLRTDKENLAEALLEHTLITGEDGPYGLYIKTVNGIPADYDADQTYWKLSQNGTELMTGVSGVTVTNGAHYEFTRTR